MAFKKGTFKKIGLVLLAIGVGVGGYFAYKMRTIKDSNGNTFKLSGIGHASGDRTVLVNDQPNGLAVSLSEKDGIVYAVNKGGQRWKWNQPGGWTLA